MIRAAFITVMLAAAAFDAVAIVTTIRLARAVPASWQGLL